MSKHLEQLDQVYQRMIAYYEGDPNRIQHFVKVHSFAALLGRMEGLDEETLFVLEAAAYVHDIGIKPSLERYGDCIGSHQEELGPKEAEKLLANLDFLPEETERISYLVGHHHTYTNIDGIDYQILVEADFLVNLYEEQSDTAVIDHVYETIFQTAAGKQILLTMFGRSHA
jgi:HD superfamily phosphodiesterase